jgi:hypothetical protein
VLVIGRRACGVSHPKLTEILHSDFYNYAAIAGRLVGYNACFFCLGVSSIGKSEEEYRRLTYDLTLAAGNALAAASPAISFCYVSGAGTDSTEQGRVMWARVKGKTENDLRKLPFRAVYAYRPGFIRPTPGLKNTLPFARPLAPLYPLLRRLIPQYVCTLEDLGRSMIHVAADGWPDWILECRDITQSARAHAAAGVPSRQG